MPHGTAVLRALRARVAARERQPDPGARNGAGSAPLTLTFTSSVSTAARSLHWNVSTAWWQVLARRRTRRARSTIPTSCGRLGAAARTARPPAGRRAFRNFRPRCNGERAPAPLKPSPFSNTRLTRAHPLLQPELTSPRAGCARTPRSPSASTLGRHMLQGDAAGHRPPSTVPSLPPTR